MTSYKGYTGLTEYHSDTTDVSGDITITLAETPTSVNHVAVFSPDATYFPKIQSVGTNEVVVRFYTIDNEEISIARLPENLPGGVTAQDARFETGTTTNFSGNLGASSSTNKYHTHRVEFQYEHSHALTGIGFTETNVAWTAATTTAVTCVVIYATPAL